MKVLFFGVDQKSAYIRALYSELSKLVSIDLKNDIFQRIDFAAYDIIHIHWPEAFFNWEKPSKGAYSKYVKILRALPKKKTICTKHNLTPNVDWGSTGRKIYNIVDNKSRFFIHLGKNTALEHTFSHPENSAVIPHGLLRAQDNTHENTSLEDLNIPSDCFVVLVFGTIRNYEEQRLVQIFCNNLNIKNKQIIIANWRNATLPSIFKDPLKRLKVEFLNYQFERQKFVTILDGYIKEEKLKSYFNAADVSFIPRIKAANSGVLFLSLSFEIPFIVRETGNVADYGVGLNFKSISELIDLAQDTGNWTNSKMKRYKERVRHTKSVVPSWQEIARSHKDVYCDLLNRE